MIFYININIGFGKTPKNVSGLKTHCFRLSWSKFSKSLSLIHNKITVCISRYIIKDYIYFSNLQFIYLFCFYISDA